MPNRNWLQLLAIVGLTFGLAGFAYAQPIDGNASGQPAASQSQQKPAREAEPKPAPTVQDLLQRIAGALEAANSKTESADEREHAQRDLDAQEGMAKWAKYMLWAGGADVVLTVVGIVLIWRTLVHTRKAAESAKDMVDEAVKTTAAAIDAANAATTANEIAREMGQRQMRAYVSLEKMTITVFEVGKPVQIDVELKNSGQTPAKQLRGITEYFHCVDQGSLKIRFQKGTNISTIDVGAGGPCKMPVSDGIPLTRERYRAIASRDETLVVAGVHRYDDVFGKRHLLVFKGYLVVGHDGETRLVAAGKYNNSN